MNNRLTLLAVLLGVQVLLVAGLSLGRGGPEKGSSLVTLDTGSVTRLEITDGEGATVELDKTADGWQANGDLLADSAKISELLDKFAGFTNLWPVATTSGSQSRFEVSEDKFQRRLEIDTADGGKDVIYLGTSPGYRRVHARNADSDEVFSVEFANYEVPTTVSEWVDKTQLQGEGVTAVSLDDTWRLEQSGDLWLLDGEPANQDAASALVERIAKLRLIGVFEGDEATLGEPRVIRVEDAQGTHELTFRHDEDKDEYVVNSSRRQGNFTVASYVAEQVLVEPAALLPSADEDAESAGESEQAGGRGEGDAEPAPAAPGSTQGGA
jgi:hypothetical protein